MPRRPFLPLRTQRLLIRPFERTDITRFTTYRNDPEVARYQDWDLPWTRDHTHALLDSQEHLDGAAPGRWVQLAIDDGTGLVGDLAVWLDQNSELAMIGYTLAPEVHGRGYATEAAGALVSRLFDRVGVHRVSATLDPANVSSARVLERLGFRYEGRGVSAARVRGTWEDDDRYAVLADEFRAWQRRPLHEPDVVELVEVTADNVRRTTRLATHRSQERLVATVAESIADAMFPEVENGAPVVPWMRAVEADGELVGFVMLAAATEHHPEAYLWRLLVDRWHQGRGIGRRILELVIEHVRSGGASVLDTSYVEGPGSPAPFYAQLGFVPTGEIDDDETVARLDLSATS